ncbi:MAG: zinc metallopeptidase [Planctomycetaceae bacterium]|nr:zinc metallopeptidase [Planctomycetaceae bacterium]
MYLVFLSPALLLMAWAQWRVKSAYARGMKVPAPLSGAAAARYILDHAGLNDIAVEETQGHLSDHYDPGAKVLRLSTEVYRTQSMAAVGIAAHEAGHALQHAQGYFPLSLRSASVPAATVGPWLSYILLIVGALMTSKALVLAGLVVFLGVLFFQVVTLPVEFDASNRAKAVLADLNIVDHDGALVVRDVLNAAGWTYVAVALQSLLTFLYYVLRFSGILRSDD